MDSSSGITSSLVGAIFKIQQSIPSGSIKKGPHSIVRAADLNDGIEIKRRFGEGSKPLFSRNDIAVNQTDFDRRDASSTQDHALGLKSKINRISSSTESSSPERYRHRENRKHSSPPSSRHKSRDKRKSRSPSPPKKKTVKKLPYYRDKQREKDRLGRLYGYSRSRSPQLPYYRDKQREKDRLGRLYGYSRSRSPLSTSGRKGSPMAQRRFKNSPKRRSASRERYRRLSLYRRSRRDYRNRRSRTRSRTCSPQRRECYKCSSKDVDKGGKQDSHSNAVTSARTQYIPVPVPADYAAYSFPGWTHPQPYWHPNHRPPPASHFAPFPMWPMMPPIRPPHLPSYRGMALPPPIYSTNYQLRRHVPTTIGSSLRNDPNPIRPRIVKSATAVSD